MAVTAKPLINAKYASSSATTEYTASSVRTIIDKFTATNSDASSQTITVYIVPSGGSVADSNAIVRSLSIASNTCTDLTQLQNQILASGDFISVVASVGSKVVIRASGREVT